MNRKSKPFVLVVARCSTLALALIFTMATLGDAPGTAAAQDELTLCYDDGSPEWEFTFSKTHLKFANKFRAPGGTWQLVTLYYYVIRDVGEPFFASILEDDGSGAPGAWMIEPFEVEIANTGWFTVDVSADDIWVDGDFFIAMELGFGNAFFGRDERDNAHAWAHHFLYGWQQAQATYFVCAGLRSAGGSCMVLSAIGG